MANNKVSSLFKMDLPDPKRSNFNLGRVNRFTADAGWVIPCYTEEILPNSYKRLDVEALIQTNATIAPLMGSFKVKIDAFFVPLRLYYRHLDLNNIRPNFDDNFDYHYIEMPSLDNVVNVDTDENYLPPITINRGTYLTYTRRYNPELDGGNAYTMADTNLTVGPSTLLDYLGVLPVGYNHKSWKGSKHLNGNTFIAYFDIWRNYYSNPHDPLVPFRVQNAKYDPVLEYQRPGQTTYVDRYVRLDTFDRFIEYINTNSVSNGSPRSQNVIDVFNMHVHPDLSTANLNNDVYSSRIPLFQGQFCGRYTGVVHNQGFELYDTLDSIHYGLLPRTYMDDYFNSRFLNSFVTYMEDSSRVVVENNTFTITQLRLQNRIAKYVDKSIFSDTRFGSWIKSHFGVKASNKLNIPQFLGSITTNMVFNDIYASAQTGSGDITSNEALGSRASLGQGYLNHKGSFVEFKATEPGYLMCMFSIIPYVSYTQGIRKMFLKNSFKDMYKPEFDAVGYDDLQKLEMYAIGNLSSNFIPQQQQNFESSSPAVDINEFNVSIGKHPAWLEYMTAVDESHGLMTKRYEFGAWVLNRPFAPNIYDESFGLVLDANNVPHSYLSQAPQFDASTYIRPEFFNTIFAVDKYTDNFQVQIRFYDKTKQPMSKQILPHL